VDAPIDYIHVDMGSQHAPGPNGKPWWYVNDVNPLATVPSLYDEGDAKFAISGTFEIDPPTDHILANYSRPAADGLVPQTKEELHAVQMHVGWMGGRKLVPQMYALLQEQDPAVAASKAAKLTSVLRECNARMEQQSTGGPFFLGEQLSYADIAIVPFLDRFEATLGYYRGYELLARDDPSLARMRALLDAAREREAFKATSQEPDFYIKSYKGYGKEAAAEKMQVEEEVSARL
jgi:glutathione S-transferase